MSMIQQGPARINWPISLFPVWPLYLFESDATPDNTKQVDEKDSVIPDHGKAVRCAYCKSVITYQGNAESMAGKHVHRFVNPGGYEFTIACYRRAWCKIMGLPMQEWSWFPAYTWQYALCPQCQEHLGWYYRSAPDNSSFYGLILDRLIIEESDNNPE